MKCLSYRRLAAMFAGAALGLYAAAANAGNLTLTIEGIAAPIDIVSFNFGAFRDATTVDYTAASFSALESPATPLQLLWTSNGQQRASAQFHLVNPATMAPISDWTFTRVQITGVSVVSATTPVPTSSFLLAFNKVVYKVYAANGTVASQMCWDNVLKAAC